MVRLVAHVRVEPALHGRVRARVRRSSRWARACPRSRGFSRTGSRKPPRSAKPLADAVHRLEEPARQPQARPDSQSGSARHRGADRRVARQRRAVPRFPIARRGAQSRERERPAEDRRTFRTERRCREDRNVRQRAPVQQVVGHLEARRASGRRSRPAGRPGATRPAGPRCRPGSWPNRSTSARARRRRRIPAGRRR